MAGIKEVAQKVAAATGLSQKDAAEVSLAALDAIAELAANGEKVIFKGYGTFRYKTTAAGERTNPQKPGEKVQVPERTKLTFKASK